MLQCKDIYTESIIFSFDLKSPIIKLGDMLNDPESTSFSWVNDELKKLLAHDSEGGGALSGDNISLDYFLNRQERYISPFFEKLYKHYYDAETLENLANRVALIIVSKFLKNWSKLADAVFADYNPTENYNMIENRNTDFNEHTVTENSETVTNKYSGFNSGDSLSTVSQSDTNGDIDTSKTDSGSSATNELTRRGNIGVTTTQQMIESSFNLAKKNLLNVIYHDIDTILFIDYYC